MKLAPVILFVYNRPWHTRQVLEALSNNALADGSELFVFADGPKDNASAEDLLKIKEVQEVVKEKQWCKKVDLIVSEKNKGIEASEIEGISAIVERFGKVIVLEDDIVTSPHFLKFMNEGLDAYEAVSNVYSINGYMYPIETERYNSVLLPFPCGWGWATWKNKWAEFEQVMLHPGLVTGNEFLRSRFNIANSGHHLILDANTWDIRWMYTLFIKNGLGLSPTKSLMFNIGFDGSGVHYDQKVDIHQTLTDKEIRVIKTNAIDLEIYARILDYHSSSHPSGKPGRLVPRLLKKGMNQLRKIIKR